MSTGGFNWQQLAEEAGFFIGRFGAGGFMSSFANKMKWPLVMEQLDPVKLTPTGLIWVFEEDDLPDDLELGTELKTAKKRYSNNATPDVQVLGTEIPNIIIEGTFWSFDSQGRAPMDKAELLDAFALAGMPVRLSYMGGRLVREGFIVRYTYKIKDETDIDWHLEIEVTKHGEQVAQGTGGILTSTHGRVQDVLNRLNSDGEALEEMRSRIASPNNHSGLRDDMKGCLGILDDSIGAINNAKAAWKQASSFEEMTVKQFKDFGGKLHRATQLVHRAMVFVRTAPMHPVRAAEAVLGWAGMHRRRKLLREASITFGRVKEDLKLLEKDTNRAFKKKQRFHVVRDRDTLRQIAMFYYGDQNKWQDIAKANNITDPADIRGKRLIIP